MEKPPESTVFVMLLTENTLSKPRHVWEQTCDQLSDDIQTLRRQQLNMPTLEKIEEELQRRGSTLKNYPEMPFPELTNKEDAGNV
ncbi:hypothetical protein CTI12_AA510340 [Artemisia annua]|uniref:Uncharacterized protein n=1 Tax=Artemisia annua TaxID=35608 RepID=A0A2U1L5E1_ARTAN|nr:hypothetical protein CTI12_AA510340 [Artemisia annua]